MSFKVKAIYDYASQHEDDLNFSIGQVITVTDQDDADWYGGQYVDDAGVTHEGIFPRNFVEKCEPTAPPRPTRTRTKRDAEPSATPGETSAAESTPLSPTQLTSEPEDLPEQQPVSSPTRIGIAAPPVPAPAPEVPVPKHAEPVKAASPAPPLPKPAEAPAPSSPPSLPKPSPVPGASKPSGPPPVSEKPSSNSFKDRIAAFNKASAAPVAPFKPSGLSSGSSVFIKKPFVAPPPSRNAFVAPARDVPVAKVYRRDEDPEVKEQEAEVQESAEKAGLIPGASPEADGDEDQPKPLSLKERLALLQKQQLEQASRHADAAAKKEKPKRTPKKRMDSQETAEDAESTAPPQLERRDTEETGGKRSLEESHPPRISHPPRRKSSRDPEPHDGNEADMSGAGDTTEGQEDLTEKEDSDERSKHVLTTAKEDEPEPITEEEEEEEQDEDDVDPEIRRKEELRARMAKMSGGMGMAGMFGMIPMSGAPAPPKKKKAAPERRGEDTEEPVSPSVSAPPVPTMMALPGLSRVKSPQQSVPEAPEPEETDEEESESRLITPHQETAPPFSPRRESVGPPPIPGGRPAPPPVPLDSRPPTSVSTVKSPSEGSESDDELSERTPADDTTLSRIETVQASRAPPPPSVAVPPPAIPQSPRSSTSKRRSYLEEASLASPTSLQSPPLSSKRASRPPPPIPAAAPGLPPAQTRPPPPPPPGSAPISRASTAGSQLHAHADDDEGEGEVTEYEGDYDTDIASSVPHKDALKSHQRDSSFEDSLRSPVSDVPPSLPPPIPTGAPPRAVPPPIPTQPPQPPPDHRKSTDVPRAAPPPPPPAKEPQYDEEEEEDDVYDPYNHSRPPQIPPPPVSAYSPPPPAPAVPPPPPRPSGDGYKFDIPSFDTPSSGSWSPSQSSRAPPPGPPSNRARQSLDVSRANTRRSVDVTRPSMESGFVANDMDLNSQPGWWLQPNGLPAQLQGRKDILFESDESTAANRGKTTITRDIYVLFQDYSQTIITVRFNPQDATDVQLEQRHQAPPRALRQDQLEQSYERFGRTIGEAVATKKDTVVGDGTPQALVFELLRPFKDALLPVGTRAYGALVYSNLANASTSQNDEIRPGDIISIRNAKFQGKHGPMHQKYQVEIGKPDHVAVVAEWDGTKKKVRAWEQGRENKKVKMESFKLDDLRSGEVKIWRVMPRSWIGWEGGN